MQSSKLFSDLGVIIFFLHDKVVVVRITGVSDPRGGGGE